jgi:hypothetical protein
MRRLLAALLICGLSGAAQAQGVIPNIKTTDQNGAAFSTAPPMTAGQTYTAGRSIGINATAAGNITLTTSGGSTITLPVYVGWNTYPFAVTSFSWPGTGAGAGAVYNLN